MCKLHYHCTIRIKCMSRIYLFPIQMSHCLQIAIHALILFEYLNSLCHCNASLTLLLVMDSVLISVYLHLKARPQTCSLIIPFVEISDPRDDNGLLIYPLISTLNGTCQLISWLSYITILISSNTTKAH